jgi:hypothetical protein
MEVEAKSKTCPICNYEFAQTSSMIQIVAVLLALLILILLMF